MRLVEVAQALAPFFAMFAALAAGTDRRIARRLRQAAALDPARAVDLPALRPLWRWRLARLASAGAVRSVGGERYYLDESAYSSLRRVRRIRGLSILAVLVVALLLLWLAQRGDSTLSWVATRDWRA